MLSGTRTRHLDLLFRPNFTHRTLEEEVKYLITRLDSR
jgi:hypothetical protein